MRSIMVPEDAGKMDVGVAVERASESRPITGLDDALMIFPVILCRRRNTGTLARRTQGKTICTVSEGRSSSFGRRSKMMSR